MRLLEPNFISVSRSLLSYETVTARHENVTNDDAAVSVRREVIVSRPRVIRGLSTGMFYTRVARCFVNTRLLFLSAGMLLLEGARGPRSVSLGVTLNRIENSSTGGRIAYNGLPTAAAGFRKSRRLLKAPMSTVKLK